MGGWKVQGYSLVLERLSDSLTLSRELGHPASFVLRFGGYNVLNSQIPYEEPVSYPKPLFHVTT